MRALIITLVVVAALAGGYVFFVRGGAPARHAPLFATTTAPAASAAPPPSGAADCAAQNAHYALRSDGRVHLSFAPDGPINQTQRVGGAIEIPAQQNNLIFVVEITAKAEEHRFYARPSTSGWERFLLYPIVNGRSTTPSDPIAVYSFDAHYGAIDGLPQPEAAAPEHIFSPDLSRWIYNLGPDRRVESPVGFFDFSGCTPAAH